MVGNLIDRGSQERGIVGETPNLAARLQGIAKPNTVVISESTRRLLGQSLRARGPRDAGTSREFDRPVQVWAVLRPSSATSRFEALHPTGMTALVGREEEYELLRRRWSKAKDGEGQVVLLSGEAGIGKSRLTIAFMELLTGERHVRIALFLLAAAHQQRALSDHRPDGTRCRIGARRHPANETRQTRCAPPTDLDICAGRRALCRDAVAAERWTLSRARAHPAAAPSKNAGRARVWQVEILSRSGPLLMIFEDAHWADPTSLELFGRVVNQDREPSRAADHYLPAGIRAALDRDRRT